MVLDQALDPVVTAPTGVPVPHWAAGRFRALRRLYDPVPHLGAGRVYDVAVQRAGGPFRAYI
ncbi:hypothetical protein [Streptomyces sp. NBC_01618]|uniref:hypothetical protein n=1 Tax=Streptomyces sp. NBC_01618 TaxID=2975900 RepID=UPI003868B19B|nr:hypothetical protein OH735_25855 [Streptomyces sp. NBC_01618]